MRALNLVTLLLIMVGGINWLLVGIADFDLVAALFGGQQAMLSKIVCVLVGSRLSISSYRSPRLFPSVSRWLKAASFDNGANRFASA